MKKGNKYSDEKAIQIVLALLKANRIKKVIVSPGMRNMSLVASMQYDGSFEMFSCPDERSAAYMAVGMCAESNEPVVLSCTGATASREYLPGLTEAYYRKLPIIAITSTPSLSETGNLHPQFVDRSIAPRDTVKYSVQIQFIRGRMDEQDCIVKLNRAFSELKRDGGGPIHINLTTNRSPNFPLNELPDTRIIKRYTYLDSVPEITGQKIIISVGCHKKWDKELTRTVEVFCEKNNAVVFTDHSSGYQGKYLVHPTVLLAQEQYQQITDLNPDLVIHMGEQSGDYYTYNWLKKAKEVWRVSEDGQIRDTFGSLTSIFDMREEVFFQNYLQRSNQYNSYYDRWCLELSAIHDKMPEFPFSNIWVAKQISKQLPDNSIIHLGVSNTMRSWTFFDFPKGVTSYANVGARGIDGAVSSLIGSSLVNTERICFGVFGDLTFFYDFNVLGNRDIGSNIRIMVINNGGGAEFHLYSHRAYVALGDDVNNFVAADGHYGNRSRDLLYHYATDLGFEYLCADSKESFNHLLDYFVSDKKYRKPILFEIFTQYQDESDALNLMRNIL